MKRIPFKILSDKLSLKDIRSIRSWCKRHNISAFKDGRSWYVYEEEFLVATMHAAIVDEEKKNANFEYTKPQVELPVIDQQIEASLKKRFEKIRAKAIAKDRTDWAAGILQQVQK